MVYNTIVNVILMIIIIDHGQGNIGSLKNSVRQVGKKFKLCSNFDQFEWEDKIDGFILPGVGSFDECMVKMRKRRLDSKKSKKSTGKRKRKGFY